MNMYSASIRDIPVNSSVYGAGPSNNRCINILTNSMQSAMSIARAKCTSKEEVVSIYLQSEDVIIDYTQIPTQQI